MKRLKYKFLISLCGLLGYLLYAGCAIPPLHVHEATDTEYCQAGCEYLKHLPGRDGKMGCEEARDLMMSTGEVVTCQQFCEDTQKNGRSLEPRCWTTISSCDDIEIICRQ